MIKYEDTSHKVLGLALANGNLDVSNLSIISSKTEDNFEFGVLGASHYVKVRNGIHMLTEVFACRKLAGDMSYYSLDQLTNQTTSTQTQAFTYDFSVELIEDINFINALISQFEKAREDNDGASLMEIFPTKEEQPFQACTYVHVKENKKFIRAQTLHAYPEEQIVVYTESKFKLK